MDHLGTDLDELKYEQIEGVGFGLFGTVARVIGTELAVKIPSDEAGDHHAVEKRIYERLGHHPFILRYYGETKVVSIEWTMLGLLLQYHPAGTLAAIFTVPRLLAEYANKRTEWPIQAAEAVRYIHSKRVIHGDIGIHNFLVQNNGALALADFGGSRIDGSECLVGSSVRYSRPVPPSQLGLDPTEKDDIFALGTVLYEISTGQRLYADKSDGEIRDLLHKHIFPDLAPVATPAARVAIEKCWNDRYNNAEEVLHDLREFPALIGCGLVHPARKLELAVVNIIYISLEPVAHQFTPRTTLRYVAGLLSVAFTWFRQIITSFPFYLRNYCR